MRLKARGQMTIELMAMLPAALVVALVAVNGALFFSECAAFDRTFRSAVNTFAVSPAAGQGVSESCALIQGAVGALHASDHVDVSVSSSGIEGGVVTFTGTLAFHPTLFGAGPLTGAFGVSFPALSHRAEISVAVYRPGVII